MKDFNRERAIAGDPVITREGLKARFVCEINNPDYPLCFIITDNDGKEFPASFTNGGVFERNCKHWLVLFMAPIKKEGWINIYPRDITHSTRKGALYVRGDSCIDTIRIEWEE